MSENRTKAKDALAWTICYGGYAAAKFALCTGAVAAGFMDKSMAKQLSKISIHIGPKLKEHAYGVYLQTGSIVEMLDDMFS